jgi:uncharacterized alpha-E superfamily protein
MTRHFGWSFLDMGRRLERAINLCEAVTALFGHAAPAKTDDDEIHRLMFILELADSFITYRSRYRLDPMLPLVLDLLLVDDSNPRSLAYQLAALSRHLETLPQAINATSLTEDRRIIVGLHSKIQLADVQALAIGNERGVRVALDAAMSEQILKLPELSNAIQRRFFSLKDDQPHRVLTRVPASP